MSTINFHPAPGLGDLLDGWFVVPQNPVRDAGTPMVPSVQATMPGRVMVKPHMGDFLPGTFTVPQNPIVKNLQTGMGGLACVGGMGCACGSPSCAGPEPYYYGMSGFDLTTIQTWATSPSFVSASIPNWALWGGAAVALWFMTQPSGSEYREKRKALRSEYAGYRRLARRAA